MSGIIEPIPGSSHLRWVPSPSPKHPSYAQFKRFKEFRLKTRLRVQCISCMMPIPFELSPSADTLRECQIAVGSKIQYLEEMSQSEHAGLPLHIMSWKITPAQFVGPGCVDCQHIYMRLVGRTREYTKDLGNGRYTHTTPHAFIDVELEVSQVQTPRGEVVEQKIAPRVSQPVVSVIRKKSIEEALRSSEALLGDMVSRSIPLLKSAMVWHVPLRVPQSDVELAKAWTTIAHIGGYIIKTRGEADVLEA